MMNYEVEITNINDFELLINNKLKDMNKIPDKHKDLIKELMTRSFVIGAQVANNKSAKVKL